MLEVLEGQFVKVSVMTFLVFMVRFMDRLHRCLSFAVTLTELWVLPCK